MLCQNGNTVQSLNVKIKPEAPVCIKKKKLLHATSRSPVFIEYFELLLVFASLSPWQEKGTTGDLTPLLGGTLWKPYLVWQRYLWRYLHFLRFLLCWKVSAWFLEDINRSHVDFDFSFTHLNVKFNSLCQLLGFVFIAMFAFLNTYLYLLFTCLYGTFILHTLLSYLFYIYYKCSFLVILVSGCPLGTELSSELKWTQFEKHWQNSISVRVHCNPMFCWYCALSESPVASLKWLLPCAVDDNTFLVYCFTSHFCYMRPIVKICDAQLLTL